MNLSSTGHQSRINDANARKFNRSIFKTADQKLIEFSKQDQAWPVVFEVLKNSQSLDDSSIFHAASILKNKAMFDYVAFRLE